MKKNGVFSGMFSCMGLGTIIKTIWVGETTYLWPYYPSFHPYLYGFRLITLTIVTLSSTAMKFPSIIGNPLSAWLQQKHLDGTGPYFHSSSSWIEFSAELLLKISMVILGGTPGTVQFHTRSLAPKQYTILVHCKNWTDFLVWSHNNTDTSNTIKILNASNQIRKDV